MKTIRSILVICLVGLTIDLSAQRVDKDSIDSLIKLYYPTSNNKINRLYIIDGIPVDESKIDSLTSKSNLEIAKLAFLDFKKMNNITWERQTDIVLLVTQSSYNNKEKRKDYRKVKKKIKSSSSNLKLLPVILVDSKQIENSKALQAIKGLCLNRIKTINIYEDSVSIDKFGFNGKNGLIEIKTRK